jgi:hypothetical protein
MLDAHKLKNIIVFTLSVFMALYLGIAAATAQKEVVAWVSGGIFLVICLFLGRNIWILIPATLAMKGNLNFLPGTPAPWHLMTAVSAGFFLLRFAARQQQLTIKWTWMETSLVLVMISILQALVRNPVGISALGGSDVAGGKPYFIFAVAFVAYAIIAMADTDIKGWRWAVILYITFGIGDAMVNALSGISPAFSARVIPLYSNVGYDQSMLGTELDLSRSRFTQVAQLGGIFGLMACTLWRPIAALDITKPWRIIIAGVALVSTLLGGYRGGLGFLFVSFILAAVIRKKWLDIIVAGVLGALLLAVLVVSGAVKELPYGAQRILSVLPIEVSSMAKVDADNSSNERFEMWRTALASDRYIKNKMIGDGFNMSARELQAMRSQTETGPQLYKSWTEAALETGAYHGFHVETIRHTGVIGLIFATLTLFVFMSFAWRAIQNSRSQRYWGLVLFICMPYLLHPFWYWLIFGSYKAQFPQFIALAGMIKLLHVLMTKESNLTPGAKYEPELLPHGQLVPSFARLKTR